MFEGVKGSIITHLNLMDVGLDTIVPGFFSHLKEKRLAEFDLSGNDFQDLPGEAFSYLSAVDKFSLNSNKIQTLNPQQFNGMRDLRKLSLNGNQIDALNMYENDWNLNISELHLSENMIQRLDKFSFKNLRSLQVLDLSYNTKLQVIDNESFTDCVALQSLDLSRTNIIYVSLGPTMMSLKSLILEDTVVPEGDCPTRGTCHKNTFTRTAKRCRRLLRCGSFVGPCEKSVLFLWTA